LNRKQTNPGLSNLYARIDTVHMSAADRQSAKSALAQADALARAFLAASAFLKRAFGQRGLRATSAHS
jgi:hypothetical protein